MARSAWRTGWNIKVGIGLVDYLVEDQMDPETGQMYYNFGVINDSDREYRQFQTPDTIKNALYIMKANQTINSDLYSYLRINIQQGQINFLVDEAVAKSNFYLTKGYDELSAPEKAKKLRPFVQTTILKTQLCNMVLSENNNGAIVNLKQASRSIPKDKVSALIYALSYVRDYEQNKGLRKNRNIADYMFFSKS